MNELPPAQNRGETASNRGGIGNPPFFVTRLQCVAPAIDLVSCYKKPAEVAGRVMRSPNVLTMATI